MKTEGNPGIIEPMGVTRRHFFANAAKGLGTIALANLLPRVGFGANETNAAARTGVRALPKTARARHGEQAA